MKNNIQSSQFFLKFSFFTAFTVGLIIFGSIFLNQKTHAVAGINRQINFQGKLVNNPLGTNVADTSYTVVFKIYDNSSGGTVLWSETQTVTTADGIFRVALGSVTAFPANFNFNWDGLYLGMKVGTDNEMTPRVQLAAVPYAFNAEKVSGLTVQDTSGNASTSGTLQIANAKTINLGTQNLTFTTSADTTLTLPTTGTVCVNSNNCGYSIGTNYWTVPVNTGVLAPINSTLDLLIGGTTTTSAKFAVININNSASPVASLSATTASGGSGNGIVLGADATIQSLRMNTLTLGGNTTGAIQFKPGALSNPSLFLRGNGDIGIGSNNTSPLASLDIRVNTANNGGTQAIASVSGKTSFAGLVVDNSGVGDIFAASSSGLTRFVIKQGGVVQIGDSTNGLIFDYINGGPTYSGSARPTKKIVLSPEYPGAILTASGSATTNGSMTSDASPSASFRTYYEWDSTQSTLQDYTVAVRVTLPQDFSAWTTSNAIQIDFNTGLTTSNTNKLDVFIYNPSSSASIPVLYDQAQTSSSVKTWKTLGYSAAALGGAVNWNTAGQTATIYLKMYAKDTTNYVQVGDIVLNYLSKF